MMVNQRSTVYEPFIYKYIYTLKKNIYICILLYINFLYILSEQELKKTEWDILSENRFDLTWLLLFWQHLRHT